MLTESVQRVMGASELTLRREERGIACQGLIEQIDPCMDIRHLDATEANVENEIIRSAVELKCCYVRGRSLLDRVLLGRRKLGLQLVGDGFGDFALNGEDIRKIAIVSLRPEMRIVARVDQLCVHPHAIGYALHAAFHQMRDPELLRDLAQVALRASFVLHHRSAANHFQVGDLGKISQNFVLHAVGKKGVRLFFAQIFER